MEAKVDIWTLFDLFQPACLVCGLGAGRGRPLCPGCEADLPWLGPACHRCALPLAPADIGCVCSRCRRQPPLVQRAFAPCRYAFPVDRLVQQLKFGGRLPVADVLGDLLARQAHAALDRRDLPAALVPVPLHTQRLRERGFNQAARIAAAAGRQLGIPVLADAVRRTRHTDAQSGNDLQARRSNLRGAFVASGTPPAHVAIVDDVATSGSTVLAVAKALRAAGTARVDAWVVARTL